jgi:hypothetical protein
MEIVKRRQNTLPPLFRSGANLVSNVTTESTVQRTINQTNAIPPFA